MKFNNDICLRIISLSGARISGTACITLFIRASHNSKMFISSGLIEKCFKKRQQKTHTHEKYTTTSVNQPNLTLLSWQPWLRWLMFKYSLNDWTEAFFQKKQKNDEKTQNQPVHMWNNRAVIRTQYILSSEPNSNLFFRCFNTFLRIKVVFVLSHAYFCKKKKFEDIKHHFWLDDTKNQVFLA